MLHEEVEQSCLGKGQRKVLHHFMRNEVAPAVLRGEPERSLSYHTAKIIKKNKIKIVLSNISIFFISLYNLMYLLFL